MAAPVYPLTPSLSPFPSQLLFFLFFFFFSVEASALRGLEPQRGLGLICLFTSSPRSFQSSLLWQTRTPKRRRVCTRVIWSGLINKSAYSFSLNTTIITFLRSVKRQQTSKDGAGTMPGRRAVRPTEAFLFLPVKPCSLF